VRVRGALALPRSAGVERRSLGAARALVLLALATACLISGGASAISAPVSVIYTIAGTGGAGFSGDGGQAIAAQIREPRSIAPTADGGYLEAQPYENVVRRVGPDGTISTVAGNGSAGYSGDGGPATSAALNFVHGASPMPDGGFILADNMNSAIRRVWPDGTITTVAGTGVAGYNGDGGPANRAQINAPRAVAALPDGGFLIPDANNHRIRRVWPDGTITTVAGTGVQGFSGDGGAATSAQLSIPFFVAPTADGGYLIDDVGNQRIRRVSASGTITTVAGTGVAGYSGDGGPATSASIAGAHSVWPTSDGGFYIADTVNARIRYVSAAGTITTVAGTGNLGFSGDGGPAAAADLNYPKAIAAFEKTQADVSYEQLECLGLEETFPERLVGSFRVK